MRLSRRFWTPAAALCFLLALAAGVVLHRRLGGHGHSLAAVLRYHCPMHPNYTADRPGSCPICGMDLVQDLPQGGVPAAPSVAGQAPIFIPQERRELMGMRSEPVLTRSLSIMVRAAGKVAYDPDLYSASMDYREAVSGRGKVQDSRWPEVREQADTLVRISAFRLRQMGLTQSQLQALERSTEPPVDLLVAQGGRVWVYAQIYEQEVGLVRAGQPAKITAPAYPGRVFQGKVRSLDPILSAETRSLRARIEVQDAEGALRLEMFVNAAIEAELGRRLSIPLNAVMDTGERKLAFIDKGDGHIEPRELRLGRQAGEFYEVLGGLKEGEKVVSSANFLVDSESRIRSALQSASEPAQGHAGH
ncbi:MAG: efflux RND transporter periplasmic adaptor subunit [Elusimicrobiota bacterium]|jgi:Cu(I)/Ag(I) efflux system membrane fusion protein